MPANDKYRAARRKAPQETGTSLKRDKQVMDTLYGITEAEERELQDWIGTLNVPAGLRKTLAKGCVLEVITDAFCPHCDRPVKVRYPAFSAAAQFIKLLFEFKLQKPSELRQIEVTHRLIRSREELEQLTDAELLAIEEGEWQPALPAST